MLKVILCKGAPASGKSTWANSEVSRDPSSWLCINNDQLREMMNGSVYTADYEKLVRETRLFLLEKGLRHNLNIILDNVNASKRNWEDAEKIVKAANKDINMFEKHFYVPLEELLERNSKRTGVARVPDEIVMKFFKDLGGKQFAHYNPKNKFFYKREHAVDLHVEPMVQDVSKPKAIICDLDGTLAKIGNESPYDASNCDVVDLPMEMTVETVKLYYNAGYSIIFCSGRMEKDRAPSVRFIEEHLPGMPYLLLMRADNDQRHDAIIKEEIFNAHIKNKYWVKLVLDDRLSVSRLWHSMGLNLFRIGDPDASF